MGDIIFFGKFDEKWATLFYETEIDFRPKFRDNRGTFRNEFFISR